MNVSGSCGGTRTCGVPDVVYMAGLMNVAGGALTGICTGVYNCVGRVSTSAVSQSCGVGLVGMGGMSVIARVSAKPGASGGGALYNPVTGVAIRGPSGGGFANC